MRMRMDGLNLADFLFQRSEVPLTHQCDTGVDLIQPSTVLALALLCYLLYNSFGRWWRPKAQGMQVIHFDQV